MSDQKRMYRLRPSVSIIPTDNPMIFEFFQSNTRRSKYFKFKDKVMVEYLKELNGENGNEFDEGDSFVNNFINQMYANCYVEDFDLAQKINKHPFNRVINFIADYLPTHEAIHKFNQVQGSRVLVIGCGAVGSWVSHLLAQQGVRRFTLCDPDIVKHGNLNRSLFFHNDIGKNKTDSIKQSLKRLDSGVEIDCADCLISCEEDVRKLLKPNTSLVINCSDYPNVDVTSGFISKACMSDKVPHIIAGGYNLHLSLIGPTILPGVSACFKCIQDGLNEKFPHDFSKIKKMLREKRNIGNLSSLAGITSSFVAFEALRVLIDSDKMPPFMTNKRGEFNFLTSKLHFSEYSKRVDCEWCNSIT